MWTFTTIITRNYIMNQREINGPGNKRVPVFSPFFSCIFRLWKTFQTSKIRVNCRQFGECLWTFFSAPFQKGIHYNGSFHGKTNSRFSTTLFRERGFRCQIDNLPLCPRVNYDMLVAGHSKLRLIIIENDQLKRRRAVCGDSLPCQSDRINAT